MTDLTADDLDVLTEALDAWVSKDLAGDILFSVINYSSRGRDGQEADAVFEERLQKSDNNRKTRKERATLLAAQLIQMKDSLVAEGVADTLGQDTT